MVKELKPVEFTERLLPIFRGIETELGRSDGNPDHFFPHWRNLMTLGAARTWEAPGAVLGAIFYADTFTGKQKACVHFLFSLPEVRGTGIADKMLGTFEVAAKGMEKSIASYAGLLQDRTRRLYKSRGYKMTEETWTKI